MIGKKENIKEELRSAKVSISNSMAATFALSIVVACIACSVAHGAQLATIILACSVSALVPIVLLMPLIFWLHRKDIKQIKKLKTQLKQVKKEEKVIEDAVQVEQAVEKKPNTVPQSRLTKVLLEHKPKREHKGSSKESRLFEKMLKTQHLIDSLNKDEEDFDKEFNNPTPNM